MLLQSPIISDNGHLVGQYPLLMLCLFMHLFGRLSLEKEVLNLNEGLPDNINVKQSIQHKSKYSKGQDDPDYHGPYQGSLLPLLTCVVPTLQ